MDTVFAPRPRVAPRAAEAAEDVRFPETPIRRLEVPGFNDVWVKDESVNALSGTHKDRLAWDALNLYRGMLITHHGDRSALPQFSIISSGSAALALGRAFRNHGFPKLKVLADTHIDKDIKASMELAHCEVYTTDLSARVLGPKDILSLTDNAHGLELTSHKDIAVDEGSYDSMAFDVINQSPDYVFVPFGTGITFKKLLYTAENVLTHAPYDPRYRGNIDTLGECNYLGATTTNPKSVADKLHSPFSPFSEITEDEIANYKNAPYCGSETAVHTVEERFFKEAMTLATSQGIVCEPSGIAGLALLLQMRDSVPKDKKILIINTGKLKM